MRRMTTTQPTMSLRELAKEYASGRIDRLTFRRRRTRLINELAAYVPPASQQRRNQVASTRPKIKSSQVKAHNNSKLVSGLITAFSLIIITGLLVIVLYNQHNLAKYFQILFNSDSTFKEGTVTPPQDTPGLLEADPIKSFVRLNDWTAASRGRLLQQWELLSQEDKYSYSSTTWFLTFSAALRSRIKQERRLAGGEASAEVNSLLAFAAHFGLNFHPVEKRPHR